MTLVSCLVFTDLKGMGTKKKKERDYSIDFSGAVTESHMAERHDTT